MKVALISICVASVLVAILGWMYWTDVTAHQPNEDWAAWNRKVNAVWRVIPVAVGVSLVSGLVSLVVPPRTRKGTIASLIVLGAAVFVAVMIWLIVSRLAIR